MKATTKVTISEGMNPPIVYNAGDDMPDELFYAVFGRAGTPPVEKKKSSPVKEVINNGTS